MGTGKYKIVYESHVLDKQIKAIPKKDREKIKKLIEERLETSPFDRVKALDGKWKGCWSLRSGNYRIIYKVDREIVTVYVIRIGDRKNVYE